MEERVFLFSFCAILFLLRLRRSVIGQVAATENVDWLSPGCRKVANNSVELFFCLFGCSHFFKLKERHM
jgi:hypothetical protein